MSSLEALNEVRAAGTAVAPGLTLAGERPAEQVRRRGAAARRTLVLADALALIVAFVGAQIAVGTTTADPRANLLFLASLPAWLGIAHMHGLYTRDEDRTDHSTGDEILGLFQFVTIGSWLFFVVAWFGGPDVGLGRMAAFWAASMVLVPLARVPARALARRSQEYRQRAIIVGAGDVGQLLARKIVQHGEYGIDLVGFVDAEPRELREDLAHVPVLGPPHPAQLLRIVRQQRIDRVLVAFSGDRHEDLLDSLRWLDGLAVRVDVVPRLFENVGTDVVFDSVEGLPIVGVRPREVSRAQIVAKRALDILVAATALLVLAPLFALIAWRIKRDSPGPVFFRQTRLGRELRPFEVMKFRTMHVGVDEDGHKQFIKSIMDKQALPQENGLFKLERPNEITKFGGFLRRTSLDELPQLINVLKGEMSLVGPRPCLPYEVEYFEPHHFERFRVPQGITGLWQITARAHSTFAEALDLDVAYARSLSLGLDLRILLRTPRHLLRGKGTR